MDGAILKGTSLYQADVDAATFYGTDMDGKALPEATVRSKCDLPPIEWRGDCYAARPPAFVPRDGGCAVVGGYLAVWFGRPDFPVDNAWKFRVGDDDWVVIPESD